MTVSYTRSPKYRLTSSTTCSDSFVRGSYMVITIPLNRSAGLTFCWTSLTFLINCPNPSSA